jgi:hypothetical protein
MSVNPGTVYQFLHDQCIKGLHDVELDALRFAMFTVNANIDVKTADLFTSLTDELVGSGYTAGGFAMTQTLIYTPGGSNRPVVDFDDIVIPGATWGQAPGTAAGAAVIYNTTAGPQLNKVMWVINFFSAIIVNGGNLTISFPDPTNPALAMVRTSG